MSIFNKNNIDSEVIIFSISVDDTEIANKPGKSKNKNLSKSPKTAKSKKLSKSGNSPKFDIKKAKPNFLTFSAREVFNYL